MRLAVVTALAALLLPAAALAGGPSYVAQGGLGVLSHDHKYRFVAVSTGGGTAIERVALRGGAVSGWATLDGEWGIPQPTMRPGQLEGLTRDGKQLIVGSFGAGRPTRFAVIRTRNLRVDYRFELPGSFAYDALSPDGRTLFLTQYVDQNDASRYVVRAYDLQSGRLVPGRIADKTQKSWVMEGSATTRTTSAGGRWVYTLFMRPGGYPFVHALDTVRRVAHCVGLPWSTGNQAPLMNMHMTLTNGGSTLALDSKSGKPWLAIDTRTWRITHPSPDATVPWRSIVGGLFGATVVLAALALALRRGRAPHIVQATSSTIRTSRRRNPGAARS